MSVERRNSNGQWEELYSDASWETRYRWRRTSTLLGHSEVEIQWDIPADALTGTYRIRHFGHYRRIRLFRSPEIRPYTGVSRTFVVTDN